MSQITHQDLLQKIKKLEYENNLLREERTLQNTVEKYMLDILNNIPAPIYLKDVHGSYLMINKRYEVLSQVTLADIVKKNDFDIFPQPVAALFRSQDEEVKQKNAPIDFEETIPLPDGVHTFITSKFPLHEKDGTLIAVGGFCTDITRRKQAEEEKAQLESQLRQVHKMEAIGTLAGGIAHDFNNILQAIIGCADMAKENAPSGTKHQDNLDGVLLAADRAKDLVKQILDFSHQAEAERIPIKIQPLLKVGLKMLRASIPATISMTEDIDPKSGVILANPTQVHQILMNLCANANHAMEETGGTLSVTLKTIFIKSGDQETLLHVTPGEYIRLTVADTGVGIGPDVIDKIFNPYFTTKEIGKGTGMGLAIIHGIMKDYAGAITVESQRGKGSTFHVYFLVVEEDALPEIKETEDIPGGKERILFIDDEELLAEMGKAVLERLGYHVTVRRSSIEALEKFRDNPNEFDLVITDQTMPGMTGSDLARQMMQIRPDIPVILCTGYSNLVDEDSAKALGIKEFALKPLTKGVIAELIRKVLDGAG